MEDVIQEFLRQQLPDAGAIEIRDLTVVAGGYSRETFRCDVEVERPGGEHTQLRLILRRDPSPRTAILNTSRLTEHRLLNRIAEHTSIPVPRSLFVDAEGAHFGRATMLLERVVGKSDLSALFGGVDAGQLESVATDLCERLAELHTTPIELLDPDGECRDPRGVGIDTASWDAYIHSMLRYIKANYENIAFDPLPVFYDAYCSLQNQLPAPVPLVLCHGDFQPSNFLYQDGKVTGIIDWELSHVGDPREDIGWLAQMQLMTGLDLMGAVKVDGGFLGHYTKLTGIPVTPEDVRFFQLFMASSIGAPIVAAVKRRLEGCAQRVPACLHASAHRRFGTRLRGGAWVSACRRSGLMFTTPSAVDVLQAIRESLANDVMPELQTDRTRVTVAMIDTMLVSLQRRIPLEQQWMADECNRMRVILKEVASELAHDTGPIASAIRLLAEGASEVPEFPAIPPFDEVSAAYRAASQTFTELVGQLNELAGHDPGRANPLLERARAYINLRCQRDMAAVFAMDAGLVGRG